MNLKFNGGLPSLELLFSGPEVFFKTCVTMKFVDDDEDDNDVISQTPSPDSSKTSVLYKSFTYLLTYLPIIICCNTVITRCV